MLMSDPVISRMSFVIVPSRALEFVDVTQDSINFYIINSNANSPKYGHWVVLYVQQGWLEWFDSLALETGKYNAHIQHFINTHKNNLHTAKRPIQHVNSDKCGYFILFYLFFKVRGIKLDTIVNMFSDNITENDVFLSERLRLLYKDAA